MEEGAPLAFSGSPLLTWPFSLRSMCQLSVSPAEFLRVNAKTALPCLMASFLSASLAFRASLMASKAAEDGNLSACAEGSMSARLERNWRGCIGQAYRSGET